MGGESSSLLRLAKSWFLGVCRETTACGAWVGVSALVRIPKSLSSSSDLMSLLLKGCLHLLALCFHFLIVALVPKAKRCQATSRDLSLIPSGSSKATTREEEDVCTQEGFCITRRLVYVRLLAASD